MKALLLSAILTVVLAIDCPYFSNPDRPLVVAHRGACGALPDHSAAAYTTAYYDGTDFNEPDLQVTKDGELFIMHAPCMKETTNIDELEQFADRKVNITFKGSQNSFTCNDDYLVNDFTWKELVDAGLKVRTRYPARNQFYNDLFPPMILDDAIELMLELNDKAPRHDKQFKTGLYIETKMVQFYKEERGIDIAQLLYEKLKSYDIETIEKATNKLPIIVESFEEYSLLYFKNVTDLPRIQLMFLRDGYNLTWISEFAHGVGPNLGWLTKYKDEPYNLDKPSKFIEECHSLGLNVHPYVLQDDILKFTNSSTAEAQVYINKGVDGLFTEFPENTLQAFEYITQPSPVYEHIEQVSM